MNLDTLGLYCDVIRSGSFSLGAASHRISQSAASQAVRQLEEDVGAQLIDRTKRPFMVTPEGKKFYDACLILLDNFEKAKAEITSQRTLVGGAVRVAVIYSVGLHDMGIYCQQFTPQYPQAKMKPAFRPIFRSRCRNWFGPSASSTAAKSYSHRQRRSYCNS